MKYTSLLRSAKYIGLAAGVAGVAVLSPVTISAKKGGENISICHATSSEKNPFVSKSVDPEGVVNGHLGHGNDIVPPFTYNGQVYSQNWDAVGSATHDNGCVFDPPVVD